uniref:Uncharacterized protein n=1 Tax=Oryza meridionalis TaxID=40149 RepID=A0A0E0FED8_9ORYZ
MSATTRARKTPYAHQSTAAPCAPPLATSGATYSCVPTNEHDLASTGSATNRGRGAATAFRRRLNRRRWSGKQDAPPLASSSVSVSPSSEGEVVDCSERSKSVSMMWPSARMRTFSGLRSR